MCAMQLNYEETTKAGTSPNVTRVYSLINPKARWTLSFDSDRISRRFGVDDPQNPRGELDDYPCPLFFSFFFISRAKRDKP